MHLGAALGVSVTAVYGPTDERITGPRGARHTVVAHQVWCRPCHLHECPYNHECMQGVGVDRVLGAVRRSL
jgi:heptosyltransferase-2